MTEIEFCQMYTFLQISPENLMNIIYCKPISKLIEITLLIVL